MKLLANGYRIYYIMSHRAFSENETFNVIFAKHTRSCHYFSLISLLARQPSSVGRRKDPHHCMWRVPYSCPEEVTLETQNIPGLSYIGIFLSALRTSWEKKKKASIHSQEETSWGIDRTRYLFFLGGTIHHLTMILKGPKFKTTPQQWRPFGACHPAIINECFKCSPFVVSIGSKQKPVLSCLCCMAARGLCCRICS